MNAVASRGVSIVIPVRNDRTVLETQLRALAQQRFDGPMEIIVSDNGSTDGLLELLDDWSRSGIRLRVVDASQRPGAAHARNAGIAEAAYEAVLGCDADDRVGDAWVPEMVKALERADLVAGSLIEWDGGEARSTGSPYLLGTAGLGFLRTCNGSNYGVRKTAWESVGGFDASLSAAEDIDFAWRLQLAGYRFTECPEATVEYRVPDDGAVLLRKWFSYGRFQPRLWKRYRAAGMTRQPILRVFGRWMVLLATSYRPIVGRDGRNWLMEMGRRSGRLVGSIECRVVYL